MKNTNGLLSGKNISIPLSEEKALINNGAWLVSKKVFLNCKKQTYPEKAKKLFLINGKKKAFWSADEFGSRVVDRMKKAYEKYFEGEILFRKSGKVWFVILVDLTEQWILFRDFGDGNGKTSHKDSIFEVF